LVARKRQRSSPWAWWLRLSMSLPRCWSSRWVSAARSSRPCAQLPARRLRQSFPRLRSALHSMRGSIRLCVGSITSAPTPRT
ncbi:hypothetical protein GGF43_006095, partial [Coemansia sp. RSA 2618]